MNPLVITHMTSPTAQKDTKLGKWKYCGQLPQVEGEEPGPEPTPPSPEPPTPVEEKATVYAPTGKTVNMRKGPSTSKALVERVPIGWVVTVLDKEPDWCQISYTDKWDITRTGWMMTQYLIFDDKPIETLYTVMVEHLSKDEAKALNEKYPNAIIMAEDGAVG